MKPSPIFKSLALAGLMLSLPVHAQRIDLLQAFELASQHDPQIAAAREQFRAQQEQLPQARSTLLPQIGLQGDASRIWEDQELGGQGLGSETFTNYNVGVGLTQPLFRRESFILLRQARIVMDQAQLQYDVARQQLALRVAEQYFAVLEAEDSVTSFDAEMRAIESQLQRAQRAFELGAGTITDVNDAQARLDGTRARRIAAENQLRVARERLRRLVGAPFDDVAGLPAQFEPEMPQPAEAEAWAELAEQRNLQVLLAQAQLDLASREVERNRAARFPRVDLVGNVGRGYQGAVQTPAGRTEAEADRASVGVQLSMPLYTGGAISSQVRAAAAQREVGYHQMLNAKREASLAAEGTYLTLVANLEQVRALEQALISIRSTEDSTQRGLELGLRTTLDLLNVQRERYEIERSLAAARYGYLRTYLQLQASIGETLDERAIEAVNVYLTGRNG